MSALDKIDRQILHELQENGRCPIVELARRVNLSKTPCTERIKRLEKSGYIQGYQAKLNPQLLGLEHIVFVQVLLAKSNTEDLARFQQEVQHIEEIESCYMIAGEFDFLLLVRTRNIEHYRAILMDKISTLHSLQQTHTYVVMDTIKEQSTFPINSV